MEEEYRLPEKFGCLVFDDATMRERLPRETYQAMHLTVREGKALDTQVAGVVANAMKDWAIEKGVTHFTHWFQPMTGITAEKHDSFLSPVAGGGVIMEFGGKELVRGESDASSFPSGGLRATFEARGYTAWDPTSYAFIKDNTLCIPTAFCSWSGEALDKKTPLLRSMDALNRQAKRVLRLFGRADVRRVSSTAGPEQEYFLIDRSLYDQRKDLLYCGRTLFGARPPKGQELEDHYYGRLKPRVAAFMRAVDEELWSMGVMAKTEHNEVAPGQHELAPVFTTANIAADHNQLTMEVMKKVARKHGLTCLLHEKPFEGVNGSGKHNNWSLQTDEGQNLLDPGDAPDQNLLFLTILLAVVRAVDLHQDLLRASVASAGNDHRLGANEAPPAIMSVFLGDEITSVLDALAHHDSCHREAMGDLSVGVKAVPHLRRDTTDRNRTSPFAFTGNKFEFRSVGSSMSISDANVVINTIVADSLCDFADELECAVDFNAALGALLARTAMAHRRIIFNGNNYSPEWAAEAERRGLVNLRTTVDALPRLVSPDNVRLFEKHKVFRQCELHSRYEIGMENYVKVISIEAHTMLEMARREILPAVLAYSRDVADTALKKRALMPDMDITQDSALLTRLNEGTRAMHAGIAALEAALCEADAGAGAPAQARRYADAVIPAMRSLRHAADGLETEVSAACWPFPTYGDLLTRV